MIIVKLSNGNVVLKDASGNVLKRLENHSYLQVVSSNAIEVYNNADKITTIYVSEVTGTQIEPAGVIPFVGDVYDLMDILTVSFFFINSGTVNAIDVNYSNTVSGLISTNVQDAIDEVVNLIPTNFPIEIQAACSDETTAITAGTNKITFRLPTAFTLSEVRASLTTAQASGNIFTVDINLGGSSILSTKLTIDNTEKTSVTAATPAVISNTTMTDDGEITVDVDQIGNGTATGLKITLIGFR